MSARGGGAPGPDEAAARLIERLLSDSAFRARFRSDPAAAAREAGLDPIDDPAAERALETLEIRESRSSLAGAMMAAAVEGVGIHELLSGGHSGLGVADAVAATPQGSPAALELLQDRNVTLDPDGVADLRAGRIDDRIVAVLGEVAKRHRIAISAMRSDHAVNTAGGAVSNHHFGRAVDIASVDGRPVSPDNAAARALAAELLRLDPSIRPTELGSPWALDDPAAFTDGAHQDHIHVAFDDPPAGGDPAPPQPVPDEPAAVAHDGADAAAGTDPDDGADADTDTDTDSDSDDDADADDEGDDDDEDDDDGDDGPDVEDGGDEGDAEDDGPDGEGADGDEDEPDEDEPDEVGPDQEDLTDDELVEGSDDGSNDEPDDADSGESQDGDDGGDSGDGQDVGDGVGPPDLGDVDSAYPGDDAEQQEIALWMGAEAQRRGLPPELPVMAALVESGMRNLPGGDADSVGFFQMRAGIWDSGDYAGYATRPERQLDWFLDHAAAVRRQRVANGLPVDDPDQYGEWIADVERPAEQYRGRYQLRLADARELLRHPGGEDLVGGLGTGAPHAGPKAQAALAEAKKYLGTPYQWGGESPESGFDCSGLVQWAYEKAGITIPRVTDQQILAAGATKVRRDDLLPGDLVFFRDSTGYVHHVGISLGGDRFLHAPHSGDVVKVSNLDEPYYAQQFTGGRRFDPAVAAAEDVSSRARARDAAANQVQVMPAVRPDQVRRP